MAIALVENILLCRSLRHRLMTSTSRAHRSQARFNGCEEEELLLWRLTFGARRTYM